MWLLDFLNRCDTCKRVCPALGTGETGNGEPGAESGTHDTADKQPAAAPNFVPPIPAKGPFDALETQSAHSNTSEPKNSARSAISGTSSIGSEFVNEHIPEAQREVVRIKAMVKSFVKGMIKGKEMNFLSVDGQLLSCTCSFDRKLRNFSITFNTETRHIALKRVKEVFQGMEPTDVDTPLDELCASFVLDNDECFTFRFEDVAARENFAMGLQIIVDGHH